MAERVGEAFELEETLTVIGDKLPLGAVAPDFALDWLNPGDSTMHPVRLTETNG